MDSVIELSSGKRITISNKDEQTIIGLLAGGPPATSKVTTVVMDLDRKREIRIVVAHVVSLEPLG